LRFTAICYSTYAEGAYEMACKILQVKFDKKFLINLITAVEMRMTMTGWLKMRMSRNEEAFLRIISLFIPTMEYLCARLISFLSAGLYWDKSKKCT
jgi:hypothetical protein